MDIVSHMESGNVVGIEIRRHRTVIVRDEFHLFYVVADELTSNVVQFVRSQIEIATEIGVHVNLKTSRHFRIPQVVFTSGQHNFGIV